MEKSAIFQWIRRFFLLLLFGWFLGQCTNSLMKLIARSIGTSEGTGHEKEVLYPSVTLCPVRNPINGSYGYPADTSLSDVYDSWVGMPERHLLRLWHTFVSGKDLEVDVSKGGNYSALIEDGTIYEMTMGWKLLDRCITYNPPMKTRPGLEGRIKITLNTTGLERWTIFVNNRNMMYSTVSHAFGSTHFAAFPLQLDGNTFAKGKSLINQYSYEIKRTKWSLKSTQKNPCSAEGIQRIDTCIEEHFQKEQGCSLPWTSNKHMGQTCPYKVVLDFYEGLVDTGMQDITVNMGCLGSCEYTEYILRHISTEVEPSRYGPNAINLFLLLNSGSYKVKEQYFLYELSDFVSDIGGYLGLLLGQSILTCYDIILKWIQLKYA